MIHFLFQPEATTRGVLRKKMFLKISQNSQRNTCVRASFSIKLQEHLLWTPFIIEYPWWLAASIHSLSHLIRFDHFIYDWIILLWTLWLTILWLFIILLRMTAPMIWLSFLFLILVLPFLSNESFSAFNDPFYFIIKLPPGESNSPPGKFPPRKFPPMFLNIPNHVF